MRFLPWLYFLIALAAVAWLGRALYEGSREDPRQLLDSARRSASGPQMDTRRAISDLDQALQMAEAQRDEALVEEILLTRARVSRTTGGLTQARADLERVLTHHRPGSGAVEAQLAAVELAAGEAQSALERVDGVLRRDPNQFEAWSVRARALLVLSKREIDAARAAAGSAFADAGLAEAERRMRKIAALSIGDPERNLEVRRLIESLPAAERSRSTEILGALDRASEHLESVPAVFAQAFRGPVQRDGVEAYLRLLRDAGRLESAVDFGLAARGLSSVENYPPFLHELMSTLIEAGRIQAAAELVPPSFGSQSAPSPEFFRTWCDALYRAERWRPLAVVANLMRAHGDTNDRSAAAFYVGIAQTRLGQYPEASVTLLRFLRKSPVEPFAGSIVLGWQAVAEGHRALGQTDEEREALLFRVKLAPREHPGAGECWLRIAELAVEAKPQRPLEAEDAFTRAIDLMPERRVELEPRWREVGAVYLRARQIDIDLEQKDLARQGLAFPAGKVDAYRLLRHAERHANAGRWASAVITCRRLLEDHPDFLPAIELAAQASSDAGDALGARDLLLERARVAGVDAWTLGLLDRLPRSALDSPHVQELVRLAPERYGRRLAARSLAEAGRATEALAGLERIPTEELADSDQLLAAELAFELGRYERAQRALASLPADVRVLAQALPLALEIAAREHDGEHARQLVRLLEAEVEIDVPALLGAVEQLIAAGLLEPATLVLDALDRRARWRNGSLYVWRAQACALGDEPELAQEYLERAFAYDTSGAAEIGLLLDVVSRRAWSRVDAATAEIEASSLEPTPLQAAALALLGERPEEARQLIDSGSTANPSEPLWTLLRAAEAALSPRAQRGAELSGASDELTREFGIQASGAIEHDPRPLVARVIALEHPAWTAWVTADLARAAPAGDGTLWTGYIAALGYLRLERPRDAELAARAVVGRWVSFEPGWDLLEDAVAADVVGPEHPRVLRLAEERRAALGASSPERVEDLLSRARVLAKTGATDGAVEVVEQALRLAPDDAPALRTAAKLYREQGRWQRAIAAGHRALEAAEPRSDSKPVAEFLDLLAEAEKADPKLATGGTIATELEFLSAHFPRDPRVEVEVARRLLHAGDPGDRLAADTCLGSLDEFRERTGGLPIDELRDGTSLAWTELLAEIDPERAHAFVRAELALRPGSVDLWRLLGATSAALGSSADAIEAYTTALHLLPDGPTARALAELVAEESGNLGVIRECLAEAARLEDLRADDPRLQVTLARALVRGGEKERQEGLALLAKLWNRRATGTSRADVVRIGEAYGVALCARGRREDRELARSVLAEVAPLVETQSRRAVIEALAALARLLGD